MKRVLFILCLLMVINMSMDASDKDKKCVNIVFIGNSITFGAGLPSPAHDAPPVKAVLYLTKQPEIASVKFSNRGVSGATTVDFLPGDSLFARVTRAADRFKDETWADLIFSIVLGTNDSAMKGTTGAPVSPQQYKKNMKIIIDQLLALYPTCRVVVGHPLWYSPNTYNGAMYLQEGLDRLQSYYPEIDTLVKEYEKRFPNQVFLGDTEATGYFKEHYLTDFQAESGNAGTFYLHPNEQGAVKLGTYWGKALKKVIDQF